MSRKPHIEMAGYYPNINIICYHYHLTSFIPFIESGVELDKVILYKNLENS